MPGKGRPIGQSKVVAVRKSSQVRVFFPILFRLWRTTQRREAHTLPITNSRRYFAR